LETKTSIKEGNDVPPRPSVDRKTAQKGGKGEGLLARRAGSEGRIREGSPSRGRRLRHKTVWGGDRIEPQKLKTSVPYEKKKRIFQDNYS